MFVSPVYSVCLLAFWYQLCQIMQQRKNVSVDSQSLLHLSQLCGHRWLIESLFSLLFSLLLQTPTHAWVAFRITFNMDGLYFHMHLGDECEGTTGGCKIKSVSNTAFSNVRILQFHQFVAIEVQQLQLNFNYQDKLWRCCNANPIKLARTQHDEAIKSSSKLTCHQHEVRRVVAPFR